MTVYGTLSYKPLISKALRYDPVTVAQQLCYCDTLMARSHIRCAPRRIAVHCCALGFEALLSVFTALHVMHTRYCDEISVCLSVCLSVTRVHCDKTEERSVQIYIPYERTFILVL